MIHKSIKSLAFYDVIGIKDSKPADIDKIFMTFWALTDTWINCGMYQEYAPLEGKTNTVTIPSCHLSVMSDSAILSTEREHPIDSFFKIALHLKSHIETQLKVYCIINKDELSLPNGPVLGGSVFDNNGTKQYNIAIGTGPSWVDLYIADMKLKEIKRWHSKYTLYCVGKKNIPTGFRSQDFITFDGYTGKNELHALQ